MFSDTLRVRIDLEKKLVRLSIRVSDNKVEVFDLPLNMFKQMVDEFYGKLKDHSD